MVMLSQLRGFEVVDDRGRREKLTDFEVALLEGDYPSVSHVHFSHDGRPQRLEWAAVRAFDVKDRRILVADVSLGKIPKRIHESKESC